MNNIEKIVKEEYQYMDAKSRLQQIESAIKRGPHALELDVKKNSREGVLAVREEGSTADPVVVRLEGKDGISIQDPGTPLTAIIRSSLSQNNMLEEGRMTPSSAMYYYTEDEDEDDE